MNFLDRFKSADWVSVVSVFLSSLIASYLSIFGLQESRICEYKSSKLDELTQLIINDKINVQYEIGVPLVCYTFTGNGINDVRGDKNNVKPENYIENFHSWLKSQEIIEKKLTRFINLNKEKITLNNLTGSVMNGSGETLVMLHWSRYLNASMVFANQCKISGTYHEAWRKMNEEASAIDQELNNLVEDCFNNPNYILATSKFFLIWLVCSVIFFAVIRIIILLISKAISFATRKRTPRPRRGAAGVKK